MALQVTIHHIDGHMKCKAIKMFHVGNFNQPIHQNKPEINKRIYQSYSSMAKIRGIK